MDTISNLLSQLGIHKTRLGFRYVHYILQLCLKDEDLLLCVSSLYEAAGKKFNTAPDNVESCIRTVVKNCWLHGNKDLLVKITKYDLKHRPTASEFLDILYCHLSSEE